jgi:hypothetical protein
MSSGPPRLDVRVALTLALVALAAGAGAVVLVALLARSVLG